MSLAQDLVESRMTGRSKPAYLTKVSPGEVALLLRHSRVRREKPGKKGLRGGRWQKSGRQQLTCDLVVTDLARIRAYFEKLAFSRESSPGFSRESRLHHG